MTENLMEKYYGKKLYRYDKDKAQAILQEAIDSAGRKGELYVASRCPICYEQPVFCIIRTPEGHVGQCIKCGTIYTYIRISDYVLTKWYENFMPGYLVNPVIRAEDWERRPLLNNYELDVIESYTDVGNLLDIGTCGGDFLVYARERGWIVAGQDLSVACMHILRELDIPAVLGHVHGTRYQEASFSVISLRHTLEHFLYPQVELEVLHHVLAEDGLLYICVPKWYEGFTKTNYDLPQHLIHFTQDSLDMLINLSGYEVLLMEDAESSRALISDEHKGIYNNIRCIAKKI